MTSLVQVTVENHEFYLDRILEVENLSFSAPWSLNGFFRELENPISQLWALMSDKALLGYFCFWAVRDEMQLLNLAVHPACRSWGHGSYLLTKTIDIALSRGVSRIWLEVRVSGTGARRLYERFGFVEGGRRRNYYTDPTEDAIIMSLELSRSDERKIAPGGTAGGRI